MQYCRDSIPIRLENITTCSGTSRRRRSRDNSRKPARARRPEFSRNSRAGYFTLDRSASSRRGFGRRMGRTGHQGAPRAHRERALASDAGRVNLLLRNSASPSATGTALPLWGCEGLKLDRRTRTARRQPENAGTLKVVPRSTRKHIKRHLLYSSPKYKGHLGGSFSKPTCFVFNGKTNFLKKVRNKDERYYSMKVHLTLHSTVCRFQYE